MSIRMLTKRRKIIKDSWSPYQTFPMLTVSNNEIQKANESIFMIEKDINCKKRQTIADTDSNSNCSSDDNVFGNANCYILYLFGKFCQSALAWIQSILKCRICLSKVSHSDNWRQRILISTLFHYDTFIMII